MKAREQLSSLRRRDRRRSRSRRRGRGRRSSGGRRWRNVHRLRRWRSGRGLGARGRWRRFRWRFGSRWRRSGFLSRRLGHRLGRCRTRPFRRTRRGGCGSPQGRSAKAAEPASRRKRLSALRADDLASRLRGGTRRWGSRSCCHRLSTLRAHLCGAGVGRSTGRAPDVAHRPLIADFVGHDRFLAGWLESLQALHFLLTRTQRGLV